MTSPMQTEEIRIYHKKLYTVEMLETGAMAKLAQFGYHVNEKRFLTSINSTKEAWKSYQWWSSAFFHREQRRLNVEGQCTQEDIDTLLEFNQEDLAHRNFINEIEEVMTQLPVVEDDPNLSFLAQPGLVADHEPEDVSPREVVGDKEESVVDKTDKHEADDVQEVIHEVIEATRPPSSEEAWYDILHGRSYPCHICGKTYKRAQQLLMQQSLLRRRTRQN